MAMLGKFRRFHVFGVGVVAAALLGSTPQAAFSASSDPVPNRMAEAVATTVTWQNGRGEITNDLMVWIDPQGPLPSRGASGAASTIQIKVSALTFYALGDPGAKYPDTIDHMAGEAYGYIVCKNAAGDFVNGQGGNDWDHTGKVGGKFYLYSQQKYQMGYRDIDTYQETVSCRDGDTFDHLDMSYYSEYGSGPSPVADKDVPGTAESFALPMLSTVAEGKVLASNPEFQAAMLATPPNPDTTLPSGEAVVEGVKAGTLIGPNLAKALVAVGGVPTLLSAALVVKQYIHTHGGSPLQADPTTDPSPTPTPTEGSDPGPVTSTQPAPPGPSQVPTPAVPTPVTPQPSSTPTAPQTVPATTPAPVLSPTERIVRAWGTDKMGNSKLQMATGEKPDPQQLLIAANRCLTYLTAAKAKDPEQRCKTTPVLIVTGKQDFGQESGQHMSTVLKSRPAWITLTYMNGAQKLKTGVGRQWYATKEFQRQCPKDRAAGAQCDEFPFYTTVEGGPKAARAVPSVLKLIGAADNRNVGRTYQQMISPCGIQSAVSTGSGLSARPAAGGKSQFLVISVPAVTTVPSFWMCRR